MQYKTITPTNNGVYYVTNNGKKAFVNHTDKVLTNWFEVVRPFTEGISWVKDSTWKILTKDFRLISPGIPCINEPSPFSNAISILTQPDTTWALIRPNGTILAKNISAYKVREDSIYCLTKKDSIAAISYNL